MKTQLAPTQVFRSGRAKTQTLGVYKGIDGSFSGALDLPQGGPLLDGPVRDKRDSLPSRPTARSMDDQADEGPSLLRQAGVPPPGLQGSGLPSASSASLVACSSRPCSSSWPLRFLSLEV